MMTKITRTSLNFLAPGYFISWRWHNLRARLKNSTSVFRWEVLVRQVLLLFILLLTLLLLNVLVLNSVTCEKRSCFLWIKFPLGSLDPYLHWIAFHSVTCHLVPTQLAWIVSVFLLNSSSLLCYTNCVDRCWGGGGRKGLLRPALLSSGLGSNPSWQRWNWCLSSLTKVLFELVERLSNLMLSLTRNEVSSWGSSKFEHSLGLIRAWARRRGGCHVVSAPIRISVGRMPKHWQRSERLWNSTGSPLHQQQEEEEATPTRCCSFSPTVCCRAFFSKVVFWL